MPFEMFKMQRHKVEVATGVVIMDSFYFFAIVLQEGRQAKVDGCHQEGYWLCKSF